MNPAGMDTVDLDERNRLDDAGYSACNNPSCAWMDAPGQTPPVCPSCGAANVSPDLFDQTPGGWTRAGITMTSQGQIGEDIVRNLGELPGYGPIAWWSNRYNSPLDGATRDWGIEVKTSNIDNASQQFKVDPEHKVTKNAAAAEAGYKGIVGVLVILDYRRSVADIYAKDFTLDPWKGGNGRMYEGVGFFRAQSDYRLLREVPFTNPFMSPQHPAPEMPF